MKVGHLWWVIPAEVGSVKSWFVFSIEYQGSSPIRTCAINVIVICKSFDLQHAYT